MKFALKYWWDSYKYMLKLIPKDVLKFSLGILVFRLIMMAIDRFPEGWIIDVVCWTAGAVIFAYLLFAVLCFIEAYKHSKVYGILDKKGFCPEYLSAFEKAFIIGKPVDNSLHISYALAQMELKNYETAMEILNRLSVPESNINQRALYIFTYMILAVRMDNSAMADDVWRCNQNFINANINNPVLDMHGNQLYLAMVYADCAAKRYERALKTCGDVLAVYPESVTDGGRLDFLVMKIYSLKQLGMDNEAQSTLQEFYSEIRYWKPSFEYLYNGLIQSAEKAIRGEIPV